MDLSPHFPNVEANDANRNTHNQIMICWYQPDTMVITIKVECQIKKEKQKHYGLPKYT